MDTTKGLLNSETILGDKPLGYIPSELIASTRKEIQNAIGIIDRMFPLNAAVTGSDLGKMAGELAEHYAGGDDGPIREPGDDMPSRSDIYGEGELCAQLDKDRSRIVKLGLYDIAAHLNDAADEITEQAETIERLSKQVRQLAAEKAVAQNWIANLRTVNAAYMEQIAEQNARLEALGAGHSARVDAAQLEAIK